MTYFSPKYYPRRYYAERYFGTDEIVADAGYYFGVRYYPRRYFGERYFTYDLAEAPGESEYYFGRSYFGGVWFGTAYFGPSVEDLQEPEEPAVVAPGRRSRRTGYFVRIQPPLPRIIIDGEIREQTCDTCTGQLRIGPSADGAINLGLPPQVTPLSVPMPPPGPPLVTVQGRAQETGGDTAWGQVHPLADLKGRVVEASVDKCEGSARVSWDTEDEALVQEFILALNASPNEVEIIR
jgi:hypothetical protein